MTREFRSSVNGLGRELELKQEGTEAALMGGGYERAAHYSDRGCQLEFGSIHNIHKVLSMEIARKPRKAIMEQRKF